MASSSKPNDQAPPSPGFFKIILKRTADGGYRVVKISEPPETKPPEPEIKPKESPLPKVLKRRPCLDEDEAKLEATARKLHDLYEQHQEAKRKRRIQVVDYLPEQQQFKLGPRAKKLPGINKSCLQKRRVVGNKGGLPISSRLVN